MNTYGSAEVKALLIKYSKGECTPQEQARVEDWYLRLNERSSTSLLDNNTEDIIIEDIRKQVLNTTAPGRKGIIRPLFVIKIAAALLLIPCAYLLYINSYKPAAQANKQFFTKGGEQKVLTLPDSTEVVLNASSTLTIGSDFGEKQRRVSLSGEAYFRVKHDASRPFIITTQKIRTRVLGTEFNVHAYPNEDNIKVAVVRGRVSVSEQNARSITQLGRVLTHNLMLSYNIKTHRHFIKTADSEKLGAWQNGELYFEDTPVEEIVLALARHYNTSIQLADRPTHNCRYTINFSGEPLPKVLAVLGQLTGITYQFTQNKIIIHSKQCH